METSERVERFHFHNRREVTLELTLEPWGMPVMVKPGAFVELGFHGGEGALEVERRETDHLVVYGWPGCTIVALEDGQQVYSTAGNAVPGTPEGVSVRGFIKAMFGG